MNLWIPGLESKEVHQCRLTIPIDVLFSLLRSFDGSRAYYTRTPIPDDARVISAHLNSNRVELDVVSKEFPTMYEGMVPYPWSVDVGYWTLSEGEMKEQKARREELERPIDQVGWSRG